MSYFLVTAELKYFWSLAEPKANVSNKWEGVKWAQDELKVATFSGVKVSQCLVSFIWNLYLSAIILFFLSNAVYLFILLVKYSCIVNILFTLNSHLFPIFNIPFFILTFLVILGMVSLVSVVSVAKKSTLYTNEMQPAVFLPSVF